MTWRSCAACTRWRRCPCHPRTSSAIWSNGSWTLSLPCCAAAEQDVRPGLVFPMVLRNQAAAAPRPIPRPHRWLSMQGALAVLSVMLVASLLVLYQAVPGPSEPPPIPAAVIAKPAMEPIAQFEFVPPMWGMPDATAWGHMEIGYVQRRSCHVVYHRLCPSTPASMVHCRSRC